MTKEDLEDAMSEIYKRQFSSERTFTIRTGQMGAQQFQRALNDQILAQETAELRLWAATVNVTEEERANLHRLINSSLGDDRVLIKEIKYAKSNR